MIHDVLFVIWFFLPVGIANMMPIVSAKIFPKWNQPIDFGKHYGDIRIFGNNKTIRGFITGILAGIAFMYWQAHLYNASDFWYGFSDMDYNQINIWLVGGLMSFGALMGDAIKSFFKRRVGIKPGDNWIPFDQIDYILGASLFMFLLLDVPIRYFLIGLLVGGLLHPVANVSGWLLKIKSKPF